MVGGTHWTARKKGAALHPCVEMESTAPSSAACSPAPAAVMGGLALVGWCLSVYVYKGGFGSVDVIDRVEVERGDGIESPKGRRRYDDIYIIII